MRVIYSDQSIPDDIKPAIFLAGPTPRIDHPVPSWRPDALAVLLKYEFDGTVLIPEYSDHHPMRSYTDQVEWEWKGLHECDVVVFWVPRDLETLPAFTTNIEFGYYIDKKASVYGRPDGAPKNTYLDWLYGKVLGKKPLKTLEDTIVTALTMCGDK